MKQDLRYKPPRGKDPHRPAPIHARRRGRALSRSLLLLVLGGLLVGSAVWAGGGLRVLHRSGPASINTLGQPRTPSSKAPPAPAAVFHRLAVTTHPPGARLTIDSSEGVTRTVRTPFRGRVAAGDLTLTVRLRGYNTLTKQLILRKNRALELWLDPQGLLLHELGTFKTGAAPKQVAFSPDGKEIWVTDLGGIGVEVFDAHTRKRLYVISLGKQGAVEVIFTGDGKTAYASQMQSASVFEIDRATHKVRRQILTHGTWSKAMALSPDEETLFVSNWVSDDVSEIDLATGKVRRVIETVDTPRGLYVTPDGKRLYVAGFEHGEIQRIDLATGASRVLIRTGGAMRHLVGDPARGLLYADDMARNEVFAVDVATSGVRRLASTDHTPNTMDLSPDGRVLYVSNRGRNNPTSYYLPGPEWGSVLAIDTRTGKILDAIVGGNQTTGLDVSSDGMLLAFSDFLDNRVSLFAVPSYEVLATGRGGRYVAHLAELQK